MPFLEDLSLSFNNLSDDVSGVEWCRRDGRSPLRHVNLRANGLWGAPDLRDCLALFFLDMQV
jgi:hypothetical protein